MESPELREVGGGDFFWRDRPRSLRKDRGQCPRRANRIGLPPRSRVLLRKRLRMKAEAKFRPCSSPKAVSTGKCPLGLRLNSGAGRRSQEKTLTVALAQHCYLPAGWLADSHPGVRCPIHRHVA